MDFQTFPLGTHLIFIPLTLAAGFFLGWILRGAASKPPRPRAPRFPPEDEPRSPLR